MSTQRFPAKLLPGLCLIQPGPLLDFGHFAGACCIQYTVSLVLDLGLETFVAVMPQKATL